MRLSYNLSPDITSIVVIRGLFAFIGECEIDCNGDCNANDFNNITTIVKHTPKAKNDVKSTFYNF